MVGWPAPARRDLRRVVEARDDGLVGAHALARRHHRRQQGGAQDRLADAGVGRGDEQPTHRAGLRRRARPRERRRSRARCRTGRSPRRERPRRVFRPSRVARSVSNGTRRARTAAASAHARRRAGGGGLAFEVRGRRRRGREERIGVGTAPRRAGASVRARPRGHSLGGGPTSLGVDPIARATSPEHMGRRFELRVRVRGHRGEAQPRGPVGHRRRADRLGEHAALDAPAGRGSSPSRSSPTMSGTMCMSDPSRPGSPPRRARRAARGRSRAAGARGAAARRAGRARRARPRPPAAGAPSRRSASARVLIR